MKEVTWLGLADDTCDRRDHLTTNRHCCALSPNLWWYQQRLVGLVDVARGAGQDGWRDG